MASLVMSLDCYWVGSLDFNFSENHGVFHPQKLNFLQGGQQQPRSVEANWDTGNGFSEESQRVRALAESQDFKAGGPKALGCGRPVCFLFLSFSSSFFPPGKFGVEFWG